MNPALRTELKQLRSQWVPWARQGGGGQYQRKIRVKTSNVLTNRPGAVASFVGIGLDENIATRILKVRTNWAGIGRRKAKDIFNTRSRTADLVWYNPPPNPAAAPGSWEPIAGHTPSIKSAAIGGTAAAITVGHGNGRPGSGRDGTRELAVDRSRQDATSPTPFLDTLVMGSLATIKYMAEPSTRLALAKPHVQALPGPRFAALTGNNDLRQPATFDSMVEHVQEERERKKWEVGSVMHGNDRLKGMVPPTIRSYLDAHGNQPHTAMEAFRHDLHNAWIKPSVNTSPESDTRDLTTKSLHHMATKTTTTGRRQRSLSDARTLPVVAPPNSRGH
ncbi:hypothetical protein [Dyella sp. OK004]|uniref:hypothetical protein n=1 Tax=Dyella sp. OK004 TaxID=1855292 RepID=UPI001160E131|nr:hypothetical protein [Dyella sp. OK004]